MNEPTQQHSSLNEPRLVYSWLEKNWKGRGQALFLACVTAILVGVGSGTYKLICATTEYIGYNWVEKAVKKLSIKKNFMRR